MRKILILLLAFALNFPYLSAQKETEKEHDSRMEWWRDARFGMFIHWGLYAVPAGEWNGKTGYGEWIRTSAEIPLATYDKFQQQLNPVEFDADLWVRTAKEAGMKYIVITSKHHDGFCMFNTSQTDFNIMKTPFARDPMKELAGACRKYDMKFCFYYSIMDWHHPDYLPRREWETDRTSEGADYEKYFKYMKAQLKELLTNYGDIGVLWFDGEWESTWNQTRGFEIYNYIRSLQPQLIVNNRVGAGRIDWVGMTKKGMFGGDFGTPEQQIPPKGLPGTDWETCMTMNDHWGYNIHDKNFKSSSEIIRMLADIASKGGNYLLNVGPTAKGTFPQESIDILKATGRWMKVNGESIHGTSASPLSTTPWGRCTMRLTEGGLRLYLHVFEKPDNGIIQVIGCMNRVKDAYILSEKGNIPVKSGLNEDVITITLPAILPDIINTVVVLELLGEPDFTDPPEISADYSSLIDSLKISITSSRPNVEIRYSISGGDEKEKICNGPITISKGCFVNARCYRNGKPVSTISSRKFTFIKPVDPVWIDDPDKGLNYSYFEGEWDSLPDFNKVIAQNSGVTDSLSLSLKKRKENFIIVYSGFLNIEHEAIYRFSLGSDDGSRLFIDDKLLIDNDGLHALTNKSSEAGLRAGYHPFRLEYLQRTGSAELQLFLESRYDVKTPVAKEMIFHE